jgi:ABC-type uncharacterized transport system involved in gliding motility auxiliary subunit
MGGWFASRGAAAALALVCIALILVAANIIVARFLPGRLDLSAEKLYTLSDGTLRTLAKIDEPITLRFYYSPRLGDAAPNIAVYAQRVRELLIEYAAAAAGKIRLEVLDPKPFSDLEDRAVAFGLQAVPLAAEGEQGYFGLAGTNSTDDQQVIPFFSGDRERFLEYDLTRLIHALAYPQKTVVGLIAGLPLRGDPVAMMQHRPSRPMEVIEQLEQLDEVKSLATTVDAIPPEIDVLMLVHPQQLSDKTLYAIDQFVLKGGQALIFVDPLSEMQAARAGRQAASGTSSNLDKLFAAWGFQVPSDIVAGDRRDALRVTVNLPGHGPQQVIDYVAWLNLREANLNREDIITASLGQVRMASAGIIEPRDGAKTTIEPLIRTSPDAMKIPVEKLAGMPDPAALLADFKPDDKRYILAARVTGTVDTAFPGGPPKPAEPAKPAEPQKPPEPSPTPTEEQVKQSLHPINVVVAADTDMLDDRFWVQTQDLFGRRIVVPTANNGDFVLNAVEVLAGGDDLIGLRTRGTSVRPFEVVDRIERDAQQRYSAEERALQEKLKETQAKLQDLTGKEAGGGPPTLAPEQAKAIDQFRLDILQTRRQLRAVQAALRSNLETLKRWIEFLDIALIPILVAVAAIVLGLVRLRRRGRRTAQA